MKSVIATAAALTLFSIAAPAQAEEIAYKYAKGQVIDFLYLKRMPDSGEHIRAYFKDIIPVARDLNYSPQQSFSVSGKPTQGNSYPEFIAVGAWPGDFNDRKESLKKLLNAVPDLHSRRMDIWSTFDMSLYEVKKDISFTMDTEKYHVLTAYWQSSDMQFSGFKRNFQSETKKAGGQPILTLTDSQSPFGYAHNPDYVEITQWDSEEAFNKFLKVNLAMNRDGVSHVSQFPIQAVKPR